MASTASADPAHLPTPPASSANPSHHPSPLPQPRRRPLQPGGTKESELIRYLDHGVNQIQKRVDNRLTSRKETPGTIGQADGYRAFWEVARDVDGLVDVVWVSGSRRLPSLSLHPHTSTPLTRPSKPPNPLPPQPRRPNRRLPHPLPRLPTLHTRHIQPPLQARLRLLVPPHRPRRRHRRPFTWLRQGAYRFHYGQGPAEGHRGSHAADSRAGLERGECGG